jgi:hypothetical protein
MSGPLARWVICAVLVAFARAPGSVWAQSRPAVTQDPETVGAGVILVDAGAEYSQGDFYPPSGLHGNLTRYGTFDVSFGVSSIADIQLDGGVRDQLFITARDPTAPLASLLRVTGSSTGDVDDGVIGAKVRFLPEAGGRPSLAIRFTTRLPNSKHASGLGMDTMDFNFALLGGKTIGPWRVVGNVGWSILEDPVRDGIQNDVVTYGGTLVRQLGPAAQVVADVNGRVDTRHGTPPVGTETRSMVRLGPRLVHGRVRYDAALLLGLTTHDPSWGVTGGLTVAFKAFTIH